ncbi:hypothetical protein GEMRC1_012960 [Eukaryota sp. GEM-RC1]
MSRPTFNIPSALHGSAARVVDEFIARKGSLNNLTLSSRSVPSSLKKAVYALAFNVLRYYHILSDIKDRINLKADKLRPTLVRVLIYDIVFGELSEAEGTATDLGFTPASAIIWNQRILMKSILEDRMLLLGSESMGSKASPPLELATEFSAAPDHHVPGLLKISDTDLIPPLHKHPRVISFDVVVQNKSSCFPVVVLNPPKNAVILDACAAPGSKTTMLAGWHNKPSKIIAVEICKKRFPLLERNLVGFTSDIEPSLVPDVDLVPASFLDIEPTDSPFNTVEYILVDAQCSGSGSFKVMSDSVLGKFIKNPQVFEDGVDDVRVSKNVLTRLQDDQIELLSHALSFPSAKKVVYSTCSVHSEENEEVVAKVLLRHRNWTLEHALPEWDLRGNVSFGKHMKRCIRCDKSVDSDGFLLHHLLEFNFIFSV